MPPSWVERARVKADASFTKAVATLQRAEAARAELRGTAAWLRQLQQKGRTWLVGGASGTIKPASGPMAHAGRLSIADPRSADQRLGVPDVLALLSAYAESSSVQGERAAAEQRREAEAAAEERRQRVQAMRGGGLPAA